MSSGLRNPVSIDVDERTPESCSRPPAPTRVVKHKFHLLDGLRGIGVVVVLWWHLPFAGALRSRPGNGFLVVDFFYCLSGFVLAFAYEEQLQQGMRFGAFLKARVLRVYPIFALALVAGLLTGGKDPIFQHRAFPPAVILIVSQVLNFLMLPSPHSALFVYDAPLYSVFFDVVAAFTFAALMCRKFAGSRILLVIAALSFAQLAWTRATSPDIALGLAWDTFTTGLARAMGSFFVGVLAFRSYRRRPHRVGGPAGSMLGGALVGAFVLVLFLPQAHAWGLLAEIAGIAFGFPLLCRVGASVVLTGRKALLCSAIGMTSYSVYALHTPVLHLLRRMPAVVALPQRWQLLVYAMAIGLPSYVAANFYEPFARSSLQRHFGSTARGARREASS